MFIEHVKDLENGAKDDLLAYKINKLKQAEFLITKFKTLLTELKQGKLSPKVNSMSQEEINNLITMYDEYNSYSKYKHSRFSII